MLVDKVYVTAVGGRGGGFEEDGGGLLGADPSDLLPEALGGPDELDNLFGLQAGLIGLCELKWQAFERGAAVCSFDIPIACEEVEQLGIPEGGAEDLEDAG